MAILLCLLTACASGGESRGGNTLDGLISTAYAQNISGNTVEYSALDGATRILFQSRGEIPSEASIDKLVRLLESRDGWVVAKSADILQLSGCAGKRALPALRSAEERFPKPESPVSGALVELGGLESIPSLIAYAVNRLERLEQCLAGERSG